MKIKKKTNKFNDGGFKMRNDSDSKIISDTFSNIASTATSAMDVAMKNAEVDTSSADNAIVATNAFQTDNSSLDALANSYDSTPWAATDYSFKDFRPGTGELAMNTASALFGSIGGSRSSAEAGLRAGLVGASALAGIFAGRAKAKKEEARLEAEAKLANQSLQARAEASRDALIQQQANQNLMNIAAYGGSLGNFSGDFSNGVIFINEGGTHEQNPFEGVPMGFDNQGTPNLVEEGEVIYNDYVFSNRLKANKKGLENIGFSDKYKNWTFAKIAEDLQKESAERPNDILSKQTLDDMMNRLIQVQEEVRMKKQQKEENKFNLGGQVNILKKGTKNKTVPTFTFSSELTKDDLLSLVQPDLPDIDFTEPEIDSNLDIAKKFGDLFNKYSSKYKNPERALNKAYEETFPSEESFDWGKFGNDALRIGAPLAAGISALAHNLAKPDYSQNERALNEARIAPTSNIVAPTEDISIRPIDPNYMTNMLRNQGNTVISNINNTAINGQQALANQMLVNNQIQAAMADAYLRTEEANLGRLMQEYEFNRGNDQFITQTAFQNFANNAARHNTIVGATAQAAAANSALDAARAQGLLASESNLAESLAGIGSENHWAQVINNHPALLYDMMSRYKLPEGSYPTSPIKKACGGKLLTKSKRRRK